MARPVGIISGSDGGSRRATNLLLRTDLREAARAAQVNLSALLEQAVIGELRALKTRAWRRDNAPEIEAYNAHVQSHGVLTDPRHGC